ncbi:MAG TPA: hypothetical protein VFE15_08250 [Marmoricola sp.]|nr:hypothetical protein [Marmoricola sp.]
MAVLDIYCGHCGEEFASGAHDACTERLRMEPPRFCTQCRRRMTVQVTPTTWAARCSEHGETVNP